jgi:hypothetical protein
MSSRDERIIMRKASQPFKNEKIGEDVPVPDGCGSFARRSQGESKPAIPSLKGMGA